MSFLVYEEDEGKQKKLVKILEQLGRDNIPVYCVESQEEANHMLEADIIEAAFISWEDTCGHGFFLSEELKRREPHINIVVMSEKPKYIMKFWKMHMSGYITGEVTREKVLEELNNLRYEPYWAEKRAAP